MTILTVESEHVSNIDTLMPFNRDDFTGPEISIYRLGHAYHHVMMDKYDHSIPIVKPVSE